MRDLGRKTEIVHEVLSVESFPRPSLASHCIIVNSESNESAQNRPLTMDGSDRVYCSDYTNMAAVFTN